MEAQLFGERPASAPPLNPSSYLQDICGLENSGESTLRLPKNFRISFRYNSEKPGAERNA